MNPTINGLNAAFAPQPGAGFDPTTDPLGIGIQGRARQARITAQTANPMAQAGPLPDPRWEGMLQAMQETGGGQLPKVTDAPGLPNPSILGLRRAVA